MSSISFRTAADGIVVLHVGFVLFVLLGGLFVIRWRWVAWLHLSAAVWGVVIEYSGWVCPLTRLENYLREGAGVAAYRVDFIGQHVLRLLYPAQLTGGGQMLLGGSALPLKP